MAKLFTRSDYILGIRCPRLLWLSRHGEPAAGEVSEWKLGQLSNELAVKKYAASAEKCLVIGEDDIYMAAAKTADALADGKNRCISGAAFVAPPLSVRCDMLLRKGESDYTLRVVRASAHVRQVACHDAAYQVFVLAACGIKVSSVEFVKINTAYTVEGNAPLFLTERITPRVMSQVGSVGSRLQRMMKAAAKPELPEKEIHNGCLNPFECERKSVCFASLPEHNVFDVGGLRRQTKFDLYREGAVSLWDVANSDSVPPEIRRQAASAAEGGAPTVKKEELSDFLSSLWYPMCFLDFEAAQLPFPTYDGIRPFEPLAFQYSLHVLDSPGAAIKHTGCIVAPDKDPRPVIAQRLVREIPRGACVVAYNMQLERQIIASLARRFPELRGRLSEIYGSTRDMMEPFLKGCYYDPKMNGSFSLKKVLAALYPDDSELDYKRLSGVHNGQEAQIAYSAISAGGTADAKTLLSELDKYCSLDTLALYKIYQKLCAAADMPLPAASRKQSKQRKPAQAEPAERESTEKSENWPKKRLRFPFFRREKQKA